MSQCLPIHAPSMCDGGTSWASEASEPGDGRLDPGDVLLVLVLSEDADAPKPTIPPGITSRTDDTYSDESSLHPTDSTICRSLRCHRRASRRHTRHAPSLAYFTILDGMFIPGFYFEAVRDTLASRGARVSYAILLPSLPNVTDRATRRVRQGAASPLRDETVAEPHWQFFEESGALQRHVISTTRANLRSRRPTDVMARLEKGQLDTRIS